MGNYRKKPVEIEAFKLGVDCIPDWFMDAVTANEVILHGTSSGFDHIPDTNADIHTLEGWHHANYGDYIVRGVKGELYPCKPDIFDMTYETADRLKTNADRIRAMSDEELKYIARAVIESQNCPMGETECIDCVFHDLCLSATYYYNNEKEWLQQPAKENDNGR